MGNTILAHALYACSRAEFEPQDIFSKEGNAHAIVTYNQSNLIAWHGDKDPRNNVSKILDVVCKDWMEILRWKLSYAKWFLDIPEPDNFAKFDFTSPAGQDPLENLTIKYWNLLQIAEHVTQAPVLLLDDYINGNLDQLQLAVEQIGWQWNHEKSDRFYDHMKLRNQCYLDWLEQIQSIVNTCVANNDLDLNLEFWERAVVLAKVCQIKNIDPSHLHWNTNGCFLQTNNVSLLKSLERIENGKTI